MALAFLWYNLIRVPSARRKLREELAAIAGPPEKDSEYTVFHNKELEGLEYLNAVIKESLRLFNPACNPSPRQTPPEGIIIDGVHIPGNVNVITGVDSIQTCEYRTPILVIDRDPSGSAAEEEKLHF